MTIDEAKQMMSTDALENLKSIISVQPTINMDNKANNDILMMALCRAVQDDIIHVSSLDDKTIKLLNAKTNTLSPSKLGNILSVVRKSQPNIGCVISILKPPDELVAKWVYVTDNVNFTNLFAYVLNYFELSPNIVRMKMSELLKPTIVNNIAQTVAKYQNNPEEDINISISTIARLVNMCDYMIFAEFVNDPSFVDGEITVTEF